MLEYTDYIAVDEFDFAATIENGQLVLRAPWEQPLARVSFGKHPEAAHDMDCNYPVIFVDKFYTPQNPDEDLNIALDFLDDWGMEVKVNLRGHVEVEINTANVKDMQLPYVDALRRELILVKGENKSAEIINIFLTFHHANPKYHKHCSAAERKAVKALMKGK